PGAARAAGPAGRVGPEPRRARLGADPGPPEAREHLGGLAGRGQRPAPPREPGHPAPPRAAHARPGRGLLRGLLEPHDLAALPRRRAPAPLPPALVALLRRREPLLRRGRDRRGRARSDRVGARLPPPARAADDPRAAPGSAGRLLPPHPVP